MNRMTIASIVAVCFWITAASAKNIQTSVVHGTRASRVDFAKELGCDSSSVCELGFLIDAARFNADPIGLAALANELGALEKASGKVADIKAADLATEAIALAKQRQHSMELKAVALILPDQASDLNAAADAAAKAEADAKANKDSSSRGVNGTLHVDSRSAEPIDVYVNGTYFGRLPPNGDLYITCGGPGTTSMFARGVFDGGTWNEQVDEVVGDFTWTLND